ncbi:putative cysteine proteinase 15A-like [Capsicum annuum]|nr:putative cysteine proteinase 15A-like [Capsicum annuum]KAF3685392.1 putative cysteine proteinase 15A-like [Capsicum annuum]
MNGGSGCLVEAGRLATTFSSSGKGMLFLFQGAMEVDTGNSCFIDKLPVERYTSTRETKKEKGQAGALKLPLCGGSEDTKKPLENNRSPLVFVNHAAIAWHENRRKWVGDVSRKSERMPKDPIIRNNILQLSATLAYTTISTRRMSSCLLHYGVQLTVAISCGGGSVAMHLGNKPYDLMQQIFLNLNCFSLFSLEEISLRAGHEMDIAMHAFLHLKMANRTYTLLFWSEQVNSAPLLFHKNDDDLASDSSNWICFCISQEMVDFLVDIWHDEGLFD